MTTTAEYREKFPDIKFEPDCHIKALCDKVEMLELIIRRELMPLYEEDLQASLEKSLKEILS